MTAPPSEGRLSEPSLNDGNNGAWGIARAGILGTGVGTGTVAVSSEQDRASSFLSLEHSLYEGKEAKLEHPSEAVLPVLSRRLQSLPAEVSLDSIENPDFKGAVLLLEREVIDSGLISILSRSLESVD